MIDDNSSVDGIDASWGELKTYSERQIAMFHGQLSLWQENAPKSVVDAHNAYRQACVDWFREGGMKK